MQECKEDVYKTIFGNVGLEDSDRSMPESVCNYLDKYHKTNQYSQLYKANKEAIDAMFQEKTQFTELANDTQL